MDDRLAKLLLENNLMQRQQSDERRLSLLEKLAIDGLSFEPPPTPGVVPTPPLGYTIKFEGIFTGFDPSSSYWLGPFLSVQGDTLYNHYVYPPKRGYIKYFEFYASTGGFSSGEIAFINVYKNGSIILTNVSTFDLSFQHGNSSNPLDSIKQYYVTESDELITEIATPAWTIEPITIRFAASLYINNE